MWCSKCGKEGHLAGRCQAKIGSSFAKPRSQQQSSSVLSGKSQTELMIARIAELESEVELLNHQIGLNIHERGRLKKACPECERRREQSRVRVARSREKKRASG